MPTSFRKGGEYDKICKNLINFSEKHTKKLIIVEGCYSYVGCKNGLTQRKYKELYKCVTDITPKEQITFKDGMQIDHLLVNSDIKSNKLILQNSFEFIDHKFIEAEFEIDR